jgi:hypothetical protein
MKREKIGAEQTDSREGPGSSLARRENQRIVNWYPVLSDVRRRHLQS